LILRKWLGWVSSLATLLALSLIIIPKGIVEVGDWLVPWVGPGLRPELYLLFLLLGPSLSYAPLLVTWILAGAVGGFFARGAARSIAAGTVTIGSLFALSQLNVLYITQSFPLTGITSLSNFPPLPQGFNIADVLSAPLVGQVLQKATSTALPNLSGIGLILAGNFVINITIFAVSFILSSILFSKVLRRRGQKKPIEQPVQLRPNAAYLTRIFRKQFVLAVLILFIMLATIPFHSGTGQSSSGSLGISPGEHLTLQLQRDGSLSMLYQTNTTLPGTYSQDESQGLVAGLLFGLNATPETISSYGNSPFGSLSSILQYLPGAGLITVYQSTDASIARSRSDRLANDFASGFNLELTPRVSLNVQSFAGLQSPGGYYLGLYTSDKTPEQIGEQVVNLIARDGVGTILSPTKVLVGQFGVLAGLVNVKPSAVSAPSATLSAFADLTPLSNFFGRGNFTLGLRQTFGDTGTIGPSGPARTSTILLAFPADFTVIDYGPRERSSSPSSGIFSISLNSSDNAIPDAFVSFGGAFPQHILIDRVLDHASPVLTGTTVRETVTVTNLGTEAIHQVIVSEKKLFQTYRSLQLLSPSYNASLGDIAPQATGTAILQFKVTSDGIYTLVPAQVSYIDQQSAVVKNSGSASLRSTLSTFDYSLALIRGTTPLSYLLLFLLVMSPLIEVPRGLVRWRSSRKQAKIGTIAQ
jgi:hypothetical protein